MSLNVQVYTTRAGKEIHYLALGKAKGKRALQAEGFAQSRNPDYFRKGNTIAHFNSHMRVWRIEYADDKAPDVQEQDPVTQDEKLTMVTSAFGAVADALEDVWQSGQGAPESPDPVRTKLIVNAIMDDVIESAPTDPAGNTRSVRLTRAEREELRFLLEGARPTVQTGKILEKMKD